MLEIKKECVQDARSEVQKIGKAVSSAFVLMAVDRREHTGRPTAQPAGRTPLTFGEVNPRQYCSWLFDPNALPTELSRS